MEICDRGYVRIIHEEDTRPLCELFDELAESEEVYEKKMESELEDQIGRLEDENSDLHAEIDRLQIEE